MLTDNAFSSYIETLYLSMVQRMSGTTQHVLYGQYSAWPTEPGPLAAAIVQLGGKVVIVVTSPRAQSLVDQIRKERPDLRFDVRTINS